MIGKVVEPLAQGKHAQTLALARSVQQGMELGTECLTDRGRDGHEFFRELEERVCAGRCPGVLPGRACADSVELSQRVTPLDWSPKPCLPVSRHTAPQ